MPGFVYPLAITLAHRLAYFLPKRVFLCIMQATLNSDMVYNARLPSSPEETVSQTCLERMWNDLSVLALASCPPPFTNRLTGSYIDMATDFKTVRATFIYGKQILTFVLDTVPAVGYQLFIRCRRPRAASNLTRWIQSLTHTLPPIRL